MKWPEVVIPLAGMLTTLVGTFVGIFAGIRTERDRWEKEQQTRFHPDRYAKYTQFLALINKWEAYTLDKPEEDALLDTLRETHAHIQLLASTPVKEASSVFLNKAIDAKLAELASYSGTETPEQLRAESTPLKEAFIEAARKELGITSEFPT
jgi:Lon protease-like protein